MQNLCRERQGHQNRTVWTPPLHAVFNPLAGETAGTLRVAGGASGPRKDEWRLDRDFAGEFEFIKRVFIVVRI